MRLASWACGSSRSTETPTRWDSRSPTRRGRGPPRRPCRRRGRAPARVDGVMTYAADRAVPVVAAVAEALDLPGIGTETAHLMTNKIAMRRQLADAGVRSRASPPSGPCRRHVPPRERSGFPPCSSRRTRPASAGSSSASRSVTSSATCTPRSCSRPSRRRSSRATTRQGGERPARAARRRAHGRDAVRPAPAAGARLRRRDRPCLSVDASETRSRKSGAPGAHG